MATYNAEEIKRLANLLAANVKLKLDYSAVANKTKKILLVEGGTDDCFINNIKTDAVDCVNADRVFNSNSSFRIPPPKPINSKNAIAQLIFGISKFPSPYIAYPSDVDKWDLYGLVDLDCDELCAGASVSRLFVTDTHDLETLLISTDKDLFNRFDNCKISNQEISQAYFVSFQLARIREMLSCYHDNKTFNLRLISCGSYQVEFESFLQNNKINIINLVRYIAQNSDNVLSLSKITQLTDKILRDKAVKKKFSSEGLWKQEFSTFNISDIPDFWTSVNGHDILQLIRYYNEDARNIFYCEGSTRLNRKFELAIIGKYDYSMIISTQLYTKMKVAELVY